MKLLGKYKNGNYNVVIFDDGTKVRETKEDKFDAKFPECMDIKITNYCEMNCPYCHEASSKEGKHGDILNVDFINTLKPYTELAIGGGNPLSHPDLLEFLRLLKEKHIIANMTVNQKHFEENINYINNLIENDLIKGIGISLTNLTDSFIEKVSKYPNAVIHVINGVVKLENLEKMYDKNLKILILGYKQFRKGNEFYSEAVEMNKNLMKFKIAEILEHFKVVSFDNLAIEQLEVKNLMTEEEWNNFYMGDDGQFTMYVDMVNKQFARCSVSDKRYKLLDNIEDMFKIIKEEK
jgi:MoaA/NifB/PqqE/SkfB family radical SAM enzyme